MTRTEVLLQALNRELALRTQALDAASDLRSITITLKLDRNGRAIRAVEFSSSEHREVGV